jgi:hypothetical protein
MFKQGLRVIGSSLLLGFSSTVLFVLVTGFGWDDFRHVEQSRFHGQILNLTGQAITFTHTYGHQILPAGKSSMDMGILDADGLIIDHPVRIGDKVYNQGLFVLCDFGKLTLRSTSQGDVLEGSPGTWLCRALNDYGFHPKLEALRNVAVYLRKKQR